MAVIRVRASPGARQSSITAYKDGEIRVRVGAPPIEGKANLELLSFLAHTLHVPRSQVRISRGGSSRHKVVEVDGLTTDEALARLGAQ